MNDEPRPGTEEAKQLARRRIVEGTVEITFGLPPTPAAMRLKAAVEEMLIAMDELHAERRQHNAG